MKINPFILKGIGDRVKLNKLGLSYFGSEFEDVIFEIISTEINDQEKQDCTESNNNIPIPDCTCYRYYIIRCLKSKKILEPIIWDEINIVTIKEAI